MQAELNNKQIINFLKKTYKSAGFVDSLKIKYRSLICPFISLIKMVQPGQKVGDVGCGSGQFLLLVSEFAKPSYLYGIEISKNLIDNAKNLFSSRQQNSFFTEYDGSAFPAQLGEMDIVFLIDVLHHVPKKMQENFIKNLTITMKPNATLILKDINAASGLVYFNKLHDMIFAGEIGNEISITKAVALLQANGLSIIKQEKRNMYVYPHYSIVAKK
jgi:2-polyprenyl-3-methyl-5-hydroxy-6-metoxy-1,4-benzoquinol methylase